jgi:hypothetical protein
MGEGESEIGDFWGGGKEGTEDVGVRLTPINMTVILCSVGNPDHGQYFGKNVLSPTRVVRVKDLAQASNICRAYIKKFDLEAGNWVGGLVYQGKKRLARVSYNGRVWPV